MLTMKPLYEPHHVPPIPVKSFALRMLAHAGVALALIALSMALSMLGYRYTEHMDWVDAFVNAAMLLSGMGPVKTSGLSEGGKLFAGFYALYSGLAFIAVMSIMLAPVVHRVLHRFHWSGQQRE